MQFAFANKISGLAQLNVYSFEYTPNLIYEDKLGECRAKIIFSD